MRDRQLRQAGRPVGSTWLPAQYTGELDESFSVSVSAAQITSERECQSDDVDVCTEMKAEEMQNRAVGTVSGAGVCRPNNSGYLRAFEEEEDRGEGSSKLAADSETLKDLEERGAYIHRKPSGMDLGNSKGEKPCRFGFGSDEDDEETDEDAPFSITSITFADPPYAADDQPVDFLGQVASDSPHLERLDTGVNSPGFSSTTTANETGRRSFFWDSIRRVLDRRRRNTKNRGSTEALTKLELPSPLPKTSIELQPLPNFA